MPNSESHNYLQKVLNLRPSLLASDQVYFSQHPGFIPCLKTRWRAATHSLGLKVKVKSCPTLCDPVDCRPSGSSVHGISQARILEWVAISFSRGSSRPRDRTQVFCIASGCFNLWATREAPKMTPKLKSKNQQKVNQGEKKDKTVPLSLDDI